MLADDSEVGRYVISTMLRRAGFSVREAEDGFQAIDEVTRQPPDLAIFDVKMPRMNGLEACRRLKEDPATSMVPVLLLSATFLDPAHQVEGLDIGADAYLTQPVEAPVLIASIRSLLRTRLAERRERQIATEWQVTFDAIGDAVALIDHAGLIRRCNRAFASLARVSLDEAIGQRFDALVPELAGTALEPGRTELTVAVGDRMLNVHVDELPDPESVGNVVLNLRDVTAQAELARERERVFRREQSISTTLQQALVPEQLPTVPGLRLSARYVLGEADIAVGGDWFDVMATGRGVWLAIGDMAGRGVAAAAQAVQLRHSLRLLVEEGYGPSEAMSRLNDVLTAGGLVEMATAVIVAIDPTLSTAQIVRAGHPPPIMIDSSGTPRLLDQLHGPFLGYPDAVHQATPLTIDQGDTLVLYTDGLVERRGEIIDAGIDRLLGVLAEAPAGGFVEHAFAALVPDAPQDDIAMLAIHRIARDSPESRSGGAQTAGPASL